MSLTLPAPVNVLIEAANAGQRKTFLNGFTPDGAVDDWGRRFTGREAIGTWSDAEFIGQNVSLEINDASTTGDTTTVTAQVGGNGFNGPSTFTFTTTDEAVTLMAITA